MDDEDGLTVFEIRIKRVITPDGEQGFNLVLPDEFSFIEGLGLLEAAKWQLYHQMSQRWGGF